MGYEQETSSRHRVLDGDEPDRRFLGSMLSKIDRFFPRRIQGRLDLLLIIVIVPVLLVQGVIYYERYQEMRQRELSSNLEMARAVANVFDGYIQGLLHQELAIGLACITYDSHTMPTDRLKRLLLENAKEYPAVRHFSWVDGQGKIIASDDSSLVGYDISDGPHFRSIIEGKDWAISDVHQSMIDGTPTVVVLRGIRDQNGVLQGVVAAGVDPQRLGEVLRVQRVDDGAIFIADTKGMVVYRYPEIELTWEERDLIRKTANLDRTIAGEETFGVVPAAIGEPMMRIAARTPISSIGWVVGASRPEAQVMAPIIQDTLRDSGLILAVAVIALIIALAIGRAITVPIKRLRAHALAVGEGDLGRRIEVEGAADIEELANAFNRMSHELLVRVEQGSFLNEASNILTSSLDYETTLSSLAHLAVPILGDICVVETLENDQLRPVAVACTDSSKEELFWEMHRRFPPDPNSLHPTQVALRCGKTQVVAEMPDSMRSAMTREDGELEMVRKVATESYMAVPLAVGERITGVLSLGSFDASRRYGSTDVVLAEALAKRAAVAVENARLYREAQKAVHVRDEFLSVAAHELKTPITSLRGFAQLMIRQLDKDGAVDPRRIRHAFEVIDQQTKKLSLFVSQLLDISRIESGRLVIERQPTDIKSLVEGVVAVAQATTNEHTILTHIRRPVVAQVDALRLEQVLINLIENAIKYSPGGGQIDIDASLDHPGVVRLAIRDRGVGIPAEHNEKIFDRFYQAHGGGHNMGMGLGLYICREIINLHGGNIEVEAPKDGGTRFIVTLPLGVNIGSVAHREALL